MARVGNMRCALSQRVWPPQPALTEVEKVPEDKIGGKMAGKMGRVPQIPRSLGKIGGESFILRFRSHTSKTVYGPNSAMPKDHPGLPKFLLTHCGALGISRPSRGLSVPTGTG